jgi:hypothetical protein
VIFDLCYRCGGVGEYTGCISVNDLLKELMAELKAKNAHWQDAGAASFTADDLVSVGKVLTSKSVGELEHGEASLLCLGLMFLGCSDAAQPYAAGLRLGGDSLTGNRAESRDFLLVC